MRTDPEEPMPRRPSEPGPKEERSSFRALLARRVAIGAGVIAFFALMSVMVYTILVVRQTQISNTAKTDRQVVQLRLIEHLVKRVDSCTTPNRPCSNRGLQQQAKAVSAISRGNIDTGVAITICQLRLGIDTPSEATDAAKAALVRCAVNLVASKPTP